MDDNSKKKHLLIRLDQLINEGFQPSRQLTMDDSIEDIQYEYELREYIERQKQRCLENMRIVLRVLGQTVLAATKKRKYL